MRDLPAAAGIIGMTMEGKVLGRCRLVRKVGEGGMGAVYLARHETLDKDVAVKILPEKFASNGDFVQRFIREARSAARLDHPNVVQVLDAGSEGGAQFIVMQYVDGTDLQQIIQKKKRISLKDALAITKKVAQALAAAHKLGLIHRDIKPANIMITKKGRVMVSDFGLARDVEAGGTLTTADEIVGTPHYLSPEQANGDKLDGRSDVYSLGATLYCMLAGKPPYSGPTALSIVVKHANKDEKPEPLRKLNPEIPQDAEALVEKMMAKDVADRFPSAEEVVEAIDRIKGGSGSVVRVRPEMVLTGKKKRRLILTGIGIAVFALIALVILLGLLGPKPPEKAYRWAVSALTPEEKLARFEKLIQSYPESEWAAKAQEEVAFLRMSIEAEEAFRAAVSMEDFETKYRMFREIVERYPELEWAGLARKEMEELEGQRVRDTIERILEEAQSGKTAFPKIVAALDQARESKPEYRAEFNRLDLEIQKMRLRARTARLGKLLTTLNRRDPEKIVPEIITFIDPRTTRDHGRRALGALARLVIAGFLKTATKIEKFEVLEEGLEMVRRESGSVRAHIVTVNRDERETVRQDARVHWQWVEGDWYLAERALKKDR